MAEDPEEVYQRVLAEEQGKGSSPAVAEARAKAARHRARKGLPTDPKAAAQAEKSGTEAPAVADDAEAQAVTQPAASEGAKETAAARATAVATKPDASGNGAPSVAPDRIQRLLAVVKPEAIQRVEREPIDRVNVWPHLMAAEFVALMVITVFLLIFSTFINAPFRELANINKTPNPSKAPWYFLGLQELLRYFHPQIAGVTIPQWIILGLMAAPFIDRNPSTKPEDRKVAIVVFTLFLMFFAILTIVGALFRGPGFNWIYPWEIQIIRIFEL